MTDKQIYAAIEAADHEVRLVIGEFFNTRFNIIKVERVPCSGLSYNGITDQQALIGSIKQAAASAKKMVGASVQQVILAIPAFNLKRISLKSTVDIEGIDGTVTIQDVRNAIKKAEAVNIGNDSALIQTVCVKYTVNGMTTRRIPLGEKCSQLIVDIDLLCADRKFAYDLVTCVEKAGLKVMDIFADIYAVGKEAALFEQSVDRQVIVLKVERDATTLGLLYKGRFAASTILPMGLGNIASAAVEKYGINMKNVIELIKYSARLDQTVCSSNIIHIWIDNGENRTISEQELVDCIRPNIETWLNAITETCEGILQAGETTVIITGEGGETIGLENLLSKRLNVEVRDYIPETLGGRNAALTACLGLFYAYQDRLPIIGQTENSLDLDAFIKNVSYRDRKVETTKEDTLTNKLKGLFLDGKK